MTAKAAGGGLKVLRSEVADAVAATEAARLHLHRRYLEVQPGALAAAGGHSAGDFACMAWLHAALRSVDEVRERAVLLPQILGPCHLASLPAFSRHGQPIGHEAVHHCSCCRWRWLPPCCCKTQPRTATFSGDGSAPGGGSGPRPRPDGGDQHPVRKGPRGMPLYLRTGFLPAMLACGALNSREPF